MYRHDSYIIEVNGSLTELINGTTDISYPISGYSNGTYYFIVVAFNDNGNSSSNCIEVIVQIRPLPGAFVLSSDADSPDSDGVFNLDWTVSAFAQNYTIYMHSSYITTINGSRTELINGTTAILFPINSYFNGTSYFIVVAFNDFGNKTSNCIEIIVQIISSNVDSPAPDFEFNIPGYNSILIFFSVCLISAILIRKGLTFHN